MLFQHAAAAQHVFERDGEIEVGARASTFWQYISKFSGYVKGPEGNWPANEMEILICPNCSKDYLPPFSVLLLYLENL